MRELVPRPFNVRSGSKGPAMIFVHGFGCSHTDWAPTIDLLGDQLCLAVDLPGHGRSPAASEGSIAALAEAVNGLRQDLGEREVILVGHSIATKVVRECFRQSPDRIRALVLVDGSTFVGDEHVLIDQLHRRMAEQGFADYIENLFGNMFIAGADPALRQHFVHRAQQLDPKFAERVLADSIRWDLRHGDAVLRSLDIPTLLIQSTNYDPRTGRVPMTAGARTPFMDKLEALVPLAEIVVMTDTGHMPMIERPQGLAVQLAGLIGRLGAEPNT